MSRFTTALAALVLGCGGKDSDPSPDDTDGTGTGTGAATGTGTGATGTGTGNGDYALRLVGDADALPAAALLSLWGTAADDMYLVGADDGAGPVVLHFDGACWSRLDTGTTGDLWWVWGDGDDTVYISGDGGRVLTYTPSSGTFVETVVADPAIKLFGVWGTSADDVWTVGGDPVGNLAGVMVHYDGESWTQLGTASDGDGGTRRSSFKVWGSATDDVWVVGTLALVTHWDGVAFTDFTTPLYRTTPLTTVHGSGPSEVYAVGGFGNAAVARWDGAVWSNDSPPPLAIAPFFNGVFADPTHGVVACGGNGQIWWRDEASGWAVDPRSPVDTHDLHACWIDGEGGLWSVGGDLSELTEGAVLYAGPRDVPEIAL